MSEAADLQSIKAPDAKQRARALASERLPPPPRLSGRSAYSIFVGVMKLLLPLLALGLIALVVLWPRLQSDDGDFRFSVGQVDTQDENGSVMINPRYEGLDDAGNPFTVTADNASQVPGQEFIIDLTHPKGDMVGEDGAWLAISANQGRYDREGQSVDLTGTVSLFHDRGYELLTEELAVDLGNGVAVSELPVHGQGPFGFVDSQGMRVEQRGAVVHFTGKSKMVFYEAPTNPAETEE
jgi:lipopolysaccharide export system protein LptC